MTWTKLSDDFSEQCRDLSDAAFRTHCEGLIWSMRRETGGFITDQDIRRFAESPHATDAVAELVACGWWVIHRQGYLIKHHMEHQPEPDLIARRRELSADRQRKFRRKKAGLSKDNNPESLTASPVPSRPDPGNASPNASRNAVTESDPRFWKTPAEMQSVTDEWSA